MLLVTYPYYFNSDFTYYSLLNQMCKIIVFICIFWEKIGLCSFSSMFIWSLVDDNIIWCSLLIIWTCPSHKKGRCARLREKGEFCQSPTKMAQAAHMLAWDLTASMVIIRLAGKRHYRTLYLEWPVSPPSIQVHQWSDPDQVCKGCL